MRWFEHRTDAAKNKKLRKIEVFYKERGGQAVMAAIGRFWRLLEIIGQQGISDDGLDSFSLPSDYGLEVLADDLFCSMDELTEFLDLLATVHSIDAQAWQEEGRVYAPKLGERADNYTKKLNRIQSKTEQCSNSVRTKSAKVREWPPPQTQTQTQTQVTTPPTPPPGGDGAGDFFVWVEGYPINRRKDLPQAEREWKRRRKRGELPALAEMQQVLAAQCRSEEWQREEGRYVPLPHRYLRLGRYVDASAAPAREPPRVCSRCKGTGFRRAEPGEEGLGGTVRCECKAEVEARGP